jgi:hypothetical protein
MLPKNKNVHKDSCDVGVVGIRDKDQTYTVTHNRVVQRQYIWSQFVAY